MLGFLYTAPIILCVFVSNLLFFIFRLYHTSVPLYQNLLTNVLFVHLSVILQVASILNATMLLTHVVFVLDNYIFSCCLLFVRHFSPFMTILCLLALSISFFISHFKSDLYIKMQHRQTATFSILTMILTSFVILVILSLYCNAEDLCELNDLCFPSISVKVIITILTPITVLNVIIFFDISIKKHIQSIINWFRFPLIIPFHGPLQQDTIELRKIPKGPPSNDEILPPPVNVSCQEHVTINTGLLTVSVMTAGAAVIIKICLHYFLQIPPHSTKDMP